MSQVQLSESAVGPAHTSVIDEMYRWLRDCSAYPQGLKASRIVDLVEALYVGGVNAFIAHGAEAVTNT